MRGAKKPSEECIGHNHDRRIPNGFLIRGHAAEELTQGHRDMFPQAPLLYLTVDRRPDGDRKWYRWSSTYGGAVMLARARAAGLA